MSVKLIFFVTLFLKEDHRFLVEPACAATLTVAYNLNKYLGKNKFTNVVVEVCGGSSITYEQFVKLKQSYGVL